ncbi:unnamed protein product [Rhizophagus irregularis]|uniref:Uncharacterized protein n=1 Tax=Rhizophagus irregularis TaxID=588596 RepID=A0A915YZV1_9GLOM|nr:unnamed protein product [Rhizophagus irregularis]CAB5356770.1 unnamed protein product [Rhizophagus irregularis]
MVRDRVSMKKAKGLDKIPVKSNQDDQTNASEAQANTSISAKESVSTESRLPELNPKEPFIIKINRI